MRKTLLFLSMFLLLSCSGNVQRATLLFEQGKVQEERGAADSAIVSYNKAIELLNGNADKKLRGEIYNQIGDLYLDNSLYHNAHDAFEEALECNSALMDKSQASYSFRGIGKSYAYRMMPDSALYYHLQAYKQIQHINDSNEVVNIYNNLAYSYLSLKQYDKAEIYNSKSIQLSKDSNIIYKSYSIKSNIFIKNHQYDSAQYYLHKSILSSNLYTKTAGYLQLAELAKQFGDSNQTKYLIKAHYLSDSIERLNQSTNIVNADKHLTQIKIIKEKQSLIGWIIGIFICGCLLISPFLFHFHKNKINLEKENTIKAKKQLLENEKMIDELHKQLQMIKEDLNSDKTQSKSDEESYLKLNTLKNILEKILKNIQKTGESCRKKFLASEAYTTLQEMVKDSSSVLTEKYQHECYSLVSQNFKPYIKILSTFLPMSKEDYYVCCLFLMGFTTKECACFRGITDKGIRSQKSKISRKIKELFGENIIFEEFFNLPK